MEQERGREPADDAIEAALEAEFGAYRLATDAPPPVPAFEEPIHQAPPSGGEPAVDEHVVDDWIEQATSQALASSRGPESSPAVASSGEPESPLAPPEGAGDDSWG